MINHKSRILQLPSQDELITALEYDPKTGALLYKAMPRESFDSDRIWKAWNARHAGKPAFSSISNGYKYGSVYNHRYLAHRIIYKMVHGEDPGEEIDHINGDRLDNRIENLRLVSCRENSMNRAIQANNTTGAVGVYRNHRSKSRPWYCYINNDGKRVDLGSHRTFDDAVAVRKRAERELGYHENHGRARRATNNGKAE